MPRVLDFQDMEFFSIKVGIILVVSNRKSSLGSLLHSVTGKFFVSELKRTSSCVCSVFCSRAGLSLD